MEFPITDLLDHDRSVRWIIEHFHLSGFECPEGGAPVKNASWFRETMQSWLNIYRCQQCETAYNLYTGAVFQQRHLTPR